MLLCEKARDPDPNWDNIQDPDPNLRNLGSVVKYKVFGWDIFYNCFWKELIVYLVTGF